jgi:regulator of RNase E activity RraA
MGRFNAMTSDMRPLFEGIRLVGIAVTVKTLAADLAAAFKAIDVSQPGDILVIDSHGPINTAFWGENMTMFALNRGVVAAVIDGAPFRGHHLSSRGSLGYTYCASRPALP